MLTLISTYRLLFTAPCNAHIVNPLTVDVARLTTTIVEGSTCAAVASDHDANEARLALFVSLGMVRTSTLGNDINFDTTGKGLGALLPSLLLDRLQSCLCIAYDKWDSALRAPIGHTAVSFGTRGMFLRRLSIHTS